MGALDVLEAEHRIICEVVAALERYGAEVGAGRDVPPGELARFAAFFTEFTEGCHHGKEERLLFPALVASGLRSDFGSLARLRDEHDEGRALVVRLSELACAEPRWTDWDRERLRDTTRAYAELLRGHIRRERRILTPLLARLPADRLARLSEEVEAFEAREVGAGEHARLRALAGELVGRYPARPPEARAHGPGGGAT